MLWRFSNSQVLCHGCCNELIINAEVTYATCSFVVLSNLFSFNYGESRNYCPNIYLKLTTFRTAVICAVLTEILMSYNDGQTCLYLWFSCPRSVGFVLVHSPSGKIFRVILALLPHYSNIIECSIDQNCHICIL